MADVNINAGEITSVRLKETTVPATPAAGYVKLYAKTDGIWFVDDAGAEFGPFLPSTLAAAKGDLLAATAADTFGVLTAGTNDYVLTADDGEATGLRWAASSSDVTADAIWDAAGDLVQGTGANTAARLAVGTANQLLRVNSGATAVEWAGVGRVLISEQTPTGTGTVTWSSIPATYKSLEIEYVARSTTNATAQYYYVYLNNDTTAANYRCTRVAGSAANTLTSLGVNEPYFSYITGATSPSGSCGQGIIRILNYASTTFNKQIMGNSSARWDNSSSYQVTEITSAEWESAAAVNRTDVVLGAGNYDTGSTFRLYGVY